MAIAASLLRSEMRRHLLMNVTLVASCVVGGTVVTNERGLFVPLTHGMSETARAFAAMFTQSHLLPDATNLTDVRMVSPLSPFEVTADSRDLRRRLMDSLSWLPEQASEYNKELAQISDTTLTPTDIAQNVVPTNSFGTPAPTSGGSSSNSNGGTTTTTNTPSSTGTPTTTNTPSTSSSPLTSDPSVLPSSSTLANPDVTPTQAQTVQENNNPTPAPPAETGAVPEPSSWAMLIAGFGLVGYFMRASRRRRQLAADQLAAEAVG